MKNTCWYHLTLKASKPSLISSLYLFSGPTQAKVTRRFINMGIPYRNPDLEGREVLRLRSQDFLCSHTQDQSPSRNHLYTPPKMFKVQLYIS